MKNFNQFLQQKKGLDEQIHQLVTLIIENGFNPERFLREQFVLLEQGFLNRTLGRFGNWWDRLWGRQQPSTYEKAVSALKSLAGEMQDKPQMNSWLNDMIGGLQSRMEKIQGADVPGEEKPTAEDKPAAKGEEKPAAEDKPAAKGEDPAKDTGPKDKPDPAHSNPAMYTPDNTPFIINGPDDDPKTSSTSLVPQGGKTPVSTGDKKAPGTSLVPQGGRMPTSTGSNDDVLDADFKVKPTQDKITHVPTRRAAITDKTPQRAALGYTRPGGALVPRGNMLPRKNIDTGLPEGEPDVWDADYTVKPTPKQIPNLTDDRTRPAASALAAAHPGRPDDENWFKAQDMIAGRTPKRESTQRTWMRYGPPQN